MANRDEFNKSVIDNYSNLLHTHKSGPMVGQWSEEGRVGRYTKLLEVGDLRGKKVLDLGCGIGDFLSYLEGAGVDEYAGIDIVPDLIEEAGKLHPERRFYCLDVLDDEFEERFDYVFMCGLFSNNFGYDVTPFMKKILKWSFDRAEKGIAFNFISTHVNRRDTEMFYHDPADIFNYCVQELSPKVDLFHHYFKCDVCCFVYR